MKLGDVLYKDDLYLEDREERVLIAQEARRLLELPNGDINDCVCVLAARVYNTIKGHNDILSQSSTFHCELLSYEISLKKRFEHCRIFNENIFN